MLFFICATDEEIAGLSAKLENVKKETRSGLDVYTGRLSGKEVGAVHAGIGKVNAAMCAQMIIDNYSPLAIVNSGIAGSLCTEINIGDIVLSTDAVEHDMDVTAFNYRPGQIPEMDVFSFEADERLLCLAEKAANDTLSEIKCFKGRIASGDLFVNSKEKKDFLKKEFGALCCEMEGAAIAHVCHVNNVPFLIIRAISDSADNSSHVDYEVFEKKAVENSVKLAEALVKIM